MTTKNYSIDRSKCDTVFGFILFEGFYIIINMVKHVKTVKPLLCNVHSLSDDILGCILFSSYTGNSLDEIVSVALVNKLFLTLAQNFVAVITFNDDRLDYFEYHRQLAINLRYVDVSHTDIIISQFFCKKLLQVKNTLDGLNLRGTDVNDSHLSMISQLTNLRFLDISKSLIEQSEYVTDRGVLNLVALIHLQWLDLSCTDVTDVSIDALGKSCDSLTHLSLQCCCSLTDSFSTHISQLKLVALDISSCVQISTVSFTNMCSKW
jgi:hypothetical protein